MIKAVIDIGSNSLKWVVADSSMAVISIIAEGAHSSRLSEGLQQTGTLSDIAMERTIRVLQEMITHCQEAGAQHIDLVGTESLRKASNSIEFVNRVKSELGVTIQIIDGEEEARLSYLAAIRNARVGDFIVVDPGGGSTEITCGTGQIITSKRSFPFGVVSLTEQYKLANVVDNTIWEQVEDNINIMQTAIPPNWVGTMIAVGGSAVTLAMIAQLLPEYNEAAIEGFCLNYREIDRQIALFSTSTSEERRRIVGLPLDRVDIILAGALILRKVIALSHTQEIRISTRGWRHSFLRKLS